MLHKERLALSNARLPCAERFVTFDESTGQLALTILGSAVLGFLSAVYESETEDA